MIPVGFFEVEHQKWNPNFVQGMPYHNRYIRVKTGELECDECRYRTPTDNPQPIHTCPVLKDGYGNEFSIGDKVYVYARSRIRMGEAIRYRKITGMLTVRTEDKDGNEQKHVINDLGKVLVIGNEE